jgi:hypothetical protein
VNRFLDYVSDAGTNLIAEWYCGISVESRAMFDDLLDAMSKTSTWRKPFFKTLGDGLGEIRWKCDNKQHRVIGCWWKNPNGYLLLIGCTHKQNIYDPPDAIKRADKRRRGIQFSKTGSVCEHENPKDCTPQEQTIP